jgi:hypothetical protein
VIGHRFIVSRINRMRPVGFVALLIGSLLSPLLADETADGAVLHDPAQKTVVLADGGRNLVLRLNYDGRCILDRFVVRGREVVPTATGVCTGIQVAGQWHVTRSIPTPKVTVNENTVTVTDIAVKAGGVETNETWTFIVRADDITWRIARKYLSGGTVEDTYFPGFDFTDRSWTGALLGTGGVAWFKLFDTPVASYGVHTGPVTFWDKQSDSCLRIAPVAGDNKHVAVRFSRHPHGVVSFNCSVTDQELSPKHSLYRFRRDRQDVWAPFQAKPGETTIELTLSAPKYSEAYDRGTLRGIDGAAVREIGNTIARLGAIDANVHGSNGWYSGFAVLQEQWIAQLGLLIDDPCYTCSYSDTLDYQRDHAVGPDGRVKPRWCYDAGDAIPNTYDAAGFYECQWGWMLDSQPCFVANVAEQFDFNGDLAWVRRHKATCEKALDYMLRRDSNGNGLVEIMPDSHAAKKGGDWADVVWTAFENGLINAQMYNAMILWADVEEQLGDPGMAGKYRQAAAKLKATFNRPIADGGLWDPAHRCYVHWRDKDGSIHGTNLFTPVNFLAIACGLCDDPTRRAAILDQIEGQMQREKLFFWPLCMSSYQKDEGHETVNWPFPSYENGDIFLAWGELGTRAYAPYKPEIAVRIVKNVIDKYNRDGLAFQRYLRKTQTGEGADILSNMASPLVGLYRNIYGIQPKSNRLYIEPHLTPELGGTRLNYWLRDQTYVVALRPGETTASANNFTLRDKKPFAVDIRQNTLNYFAGSRKTPSMTVTRSMLEPIVIHIKAWPTDGKGVRRWTQTNGMFDVSVSMVVADLPPGTRWTVVRDGTPAESPLSDSSGRVVLYSSGGRATPIVFELIQTK